GIPSLGSSTPRTGTSVALCEAGVASMSREQCWRRSRARRRTTGSLSSSSQVISSTRLSPVLLDLAAVAPVVIVAGNHDHPSRLRAVAPLLELGRVIVGSHLRRPEEGGVA